MSVMKRSLFALLLLGALALGSMVGFRTPEQVDRKQLREMLVQLGYTVKDLDSTVGSEKYSFAVTRGGLNIPVAAEISANGRFIWLTVFCKAGEPVGDKAIALLHRNADIQPSQFYVTKSKKLMLALALENHELTNAVLRERAEKIVDDVVATKDDW
jgi:hypothetical protein